MEGALHIYHLPDVEKPQLPVIFILLGLLLEAYVDERSEDATVYVHLKKLVLILSQAITEWIVCVRVEPCQKKLARRRICKF